ncbi:MAG: hypothetical protein ACFFF4_15695 [Candidatus Thorarchaeota archaeon]
MANAEMKSKIVLVRRPSLISPRHLLRYIFFTEMQVEQAAKILNEIVSAKGIVPDSDWERFVISSRGLYVKVMRKLRDVGLVEKKAGKYGLANDFSSALNKLSKYWGDIMKEFKEGGQIEF